MRILTLFSSTFGAVSFAIALWVQLTHPEVHPLIPPTVTLIGMFVLAWIGGYEYAQSTRR